MTQIISDITESLSEKYAFIEEAGGIKEFRHKSNSLQILLLEDHAAPVVTLMITYRVGSRNEGTGLTGATHFLEHLMFKGTDKFNKVNGSSIFNVLQTVGAQVNATTWLDRTNYFELLPRDHLQLAIEIEADRMRGSLLLEDELERERTVILNEFDRGENEPMRKLYQAVWSAAYVAHPYHHPTIGWRSDIENASAEGLRGFYDTFYWPNNATVSVIGDFEEDAVLNLIDQHFGEITHAPDETPCVRTREPEQNGERRITIRQTGQLGAVMIAFKSPPATEMETDALEVLEMILTSGKTSRLFRRLTDAGLTSHVFGSVSRLRDPGLFFIYAMLAPEVRHEKVEEELLAVLHEIAEQGVSDKELARAIKQIKAEEAYNRDGTFAVASQLNEAIAAGDWKLYTSFLDNIERISVEDVKMVAKKYLCRDSMTVGHYEAIDCPPR